MVEFIQVPKFVKSDQVSVANSIISLNPTGTMTLENTFSMNGSNNYINSTQNVSKNNLSKSNKNEFNCNLELFQSKNNVKIKYYKNIELFYIIIFITILLLMILLELLKK